MDVVNDRLYVSSTNDHSILIYLPDGDSSRLIEQPLKTADIQKSIAKASDNLRFGAAVAAFGQVLRGGTYTNDFGYDDIVKLAQGTLSQDAFGYRGEFVTLVNLAKSLDGTNRQAKR